jgi:hypothetical protein
VVNRYARQNFFAGDAGHRIFPLTVISSAKTIRLHDSEPRLLEWVARRHLLLPASLKSRKETFPSAFASPPTSSAAPEFEGKPAKNQGRHLAGSPLERAARKQARMAAATETKEFVFRRTQNIMDEIDILKTTLRRTEDRLNEKVGRQLQEAVKTQIPPIDIGSLSFQVYRNIERMIRAEREKRGM